MWPLPPLWLAICLAAALAVVSAASGGIGYRLGKSAGDREVLKMLKAGQAVVAKRDAQIGTLRDQSDEDAIRIAKLSHGAGVRLCKPTAAKRLPGSADPSTPGNGETVGEDITGVLRQCLRTFGQVNRAISQKEETP